MGATEDSVRRAARVLAAFMSQDEAVGFAANFVVDQPAFLAAWQVKVSARASLPHGYVAPRVEDLPAHTRAHTDKLRANPLFSQSYGANVEFKMVELGKLITMQHSVDVDASEGVHGVRIREAPSVDRLLTICLPLELAPAARTYWQRRQYAPSTYSISVFTLNASFGVRSLVTDPTANVIQIALGANPNLMLVREHDGRLVLANGYHRAWALRARGVEMVPAVVAKVSQGELTKQGPFMQLEHVLGPRPPIVDDFRNDALSLEVGVKAMMMEVKVTVETSPAPRLI